jgi:hypothetical protein
LYAFQKTRGEGVIGWNEVIEKMVGGEAKVKDVCASCNNGVLAELDAYGKGLLTDSGLLVHNYLKKSLSLQFDYAKLLRWILKISFNSSRTDGAHSHLFEEFIPFILGHGATPPRSEIAMLAYLAKPVELDEVQKLQEPFRTAAGGARTFNPFLVRISYGLMPAGEPFTLRLVMLGPLVLYIPFFVPGTTPGQAAVVVRRLMKFERGAQELSSKKKHVELHVGERTFLDLYSHQVQRTRHLAGEA